MLKEKCSTRIGHELDACDDDVPLRAFARPSKFDGQFQRQVSFHCNVIVHPFDGLPLGRTKIQESTMKIVKGNETLANLAMLFYEPFKLMADESHNIGVSYYKANLYATDHLQLSLKTFATSFFMYTKTNV